MDVSRFHVPWFSPIWYYNLTGAADFLAFSYVILPAKTVDDIPLDWDKSIVCNTFCPCLLDCAIAPTVERVGDIILFFNANGDEKLAKLN